MLKCVLHLYKTKGMDKFFFDLQGVISKIPCVAYYRYEKKHSGSHHRPSEQPNVTIEKIERERDKKDITHLLARFTQEPSFVENLEETILEQVECAKGDYELFKDY